MTLKIALIDSGIDIKHPLLESYINTALSKSFIDNTIEDSIGHGTAIAGVILYNSDFSTRTNDVDIICCKITNNMTFEIEHFINGLEYSIILNVDIINLSLSIDELRLTINQKNRLNNLIGLAIRKNIIIVASSGNNLDNCFFEKFKDKIFFISSVNEHYKPTNYSKIIKGSYKFIGGELPKKSENFEGKMVLSTYPLNIQGNYFNNFGLPKGYCYYFGTSIATAKCTNYITTLKLSLYNYNNVRKYFCDFFTS